MSSSQEGGSPDWAAMVQMWYDEVIILVVGISLAGMQLHLKFILVTVQIIVNVILFF